MFFDDIPGEDAGGTATPTPPAGDEDGDGETGGDQAM